MRSHLRRLTVGLAIGGVIGAVLAAVGLTLTAMSQDPTIVLFLLLFLTGMALLGLMASYILGALALMVYDAGTTHSGDVDL